MKSTAPPDVRDREYGALAVLSLAAVGLTGMVLLTGGTSFQRYFGSANPVLTVLLVTAAAWIALGLLRARGWFAIYARENGLKGEAFSAVGATLLAAAAITVDLMAPFPRDLNVPPPESLLFYPAIAFVAETVFHAVPLAVLLFFVGPLSKAVHGAKLVWCCIVLISFFEPVFQLVFGGMPSSWAEWYVGPHVFAINLLQLYVFRRYDFVSMYSFRLFYYILWHIVWGYARLQMLF
jgi:hypothetical protein